MTVMLITGGILWGALILFMFPGIGRSLGRVFQRMPRVSR